MAENFSFPTGIDTTEKYKILCASLRSLLEAETDIIANMANFAALLQQSMNFHWTGFYMVKNQQLVLGPFQGPVACTRIEFGKGVCGHCWKEQKSIVVQNVHEFPGHIACSTYSNSEMVIPLFNKNNDVILVLDIDHTELNFFTQEHQRGISNCAEILQNIILRQIDEKISV